MQITFRCPRCQNQNWIEAVESSTTVRCAHCDWFRVVTPDDREGERPIRCLACGCHDLWRQKDFPQQLGLLFVVLGIVLSTMALADYRPVLAIAILMGFALCDLVLYLVMRDVLVCYRCGARFHKTTLESDHPAFNLETAERYRQEARRVEDASKSRH